jgi:CRISPR-associated endonuclease/helicase Cas3
MTTASYMGYWGKAKKDPEQAGPEYHLLAYHSLDVAAVAAYWWDHSHALRQLFCKDQQQNEAEMKAWVLFFIALHDLGKFDIRFQCKVLQVWLVLHPEDQHVRLPTPFECKEYDHGIAGLYWFDNDHQTDFGDDPFALVTAHPYESWLPWLEKVCGHHGVVVPTDKVDQHHYRLSVGLHALSYRDKTARAQWIDVLARIFLHPAGLTVQSEPPECSVLLAGFCAISDWLGSWNSEDTFGYEETAKDFAGLREYYQRRYANDAAKVIDRSGLIGKVKPDGNVVKLLGGYQARQLQVLVDTLPLTAGLTIVEAPTGSGKTETALAYAWKLLELHLADSIIFALPTQATANAMLSRLETLAPLLFENPNLVLAHANSRFNRAFTEIKQRGDDLQGENALSQCVQWLSQSKKRVFLGQIGVCTIDQVLVSVLPLKHRFVRGFGAGRSVLIVDEVHAYDRYMYGLLEAVLREQANAGSPAILLSATLPEQQKKQLLASYAPASTAGLVATVDTPYPQVSWVTGGDLRQFDLTDCPDQQPPKFNLYLESRYSDDAQPDDELLQQLLSTAKQGAQVCLICNLVDVAQQAYQKLKIVAGTIDVQLFHARFSLLDRQVKENQALACFGKEGDRSRGRVLIATQVVEQSLDVDFDWLVTQICPVDLLFQRLGRLHRHQRSSRPAGFEKPKATVLLPNAEGYGRIGKIYSHTRVMWRTQQAIEKLCTLPLQFPDAYRSWIEPIYSDVVTECEPDWVTKGMDDFDSEDFNKKIKARQVLRWAENISLYDSEANERAVTRDGAMSIPLVPFVQTTKGKQLLDGRVAELLTKFQLQEALALNQVNVPDNWKRKILVQPDEFGRYWLAGQQQTSTLCMQDGKNYLYYTKERGMEIQNEPAN